ncbi:hypothetical protein OBV_33530 [Oscillibacter valericigenes Sjm18-20]|nr:hypothetical protein OBV_33530 [Oscillibacter valericigenes Sjm18-20]
MCHAYSKKGSDDAIVKRRESTMSIYEMSEIPEHAAVIMGPEVSMITEQARSIRA